jgi:hypothetical protein
MKIVINFLAFQSLINLLIKKRNIKYIEVFLDRFKLKRIMEDTKYIFSGMKNIFYLKEINIVLIIHYSMIRILNGMKFIQISSILICLTNNM